MDTHMHEAALKWKAYRGIRAELGPVYLAMGKHLAAARAETKHGEWRKRLDRAGISYDTAYRAIKLYEAGVKSCTVQHLGVRTCLEMLSDEEFVCTFQTPGEFVNYVGAGVAWLRPDPAGDPITERWATLFARLHELGMEIPESLLTKEKE